MVDRRWVAPSPSAWVWPLAALALLVCQSHSSGDSDAVATKGLVVTTPRIWLTGSDEETCFTSLSLDFDLNVDVKLVSSSSNSKIFAKKQFTLASGVSSCVELHVPSNASIHVAKLIVAANPVNSSQSYNFSKTTDVTVKSAVRVTFIQTDKPMYKPRDTVRIRILTLTTPDLAILTDDVSLAYIEDPAKTRVMQWANVSSVSGLSSLEMQLSDEPRLGEWTIHAVVRGKTNSQTFSVKEYVLPKYEVTIQHPNYMFIKAPNVTWKVCARYTYGQPVSGEVTSRACFVPAEYHGAGPCQRVNMTKLKDGCAEFTVGSESIEVDKYMYRWNANLKLSAEVKEKGTGVRRNATFSAEIKTNEFQLTILGKESAYFKPGLPVYGQGRLTLPDDTPVKGRVVKLQISGVKLEQGSTSDSLNLDLTTDSDGTFQFVLPKTFTSGTKSIQIRANVKDMTDEQYGHRAQKDLKSWYSPSGSFLQLEPFHGIAACRSKLSLPAVFVTKASLGSSISFRVQLIARGSIVHTGEVVAAKTSDSDNGTSTYPFNITFDTTYRMSGNLKALVFIILPSGETVADSLLVLVEECFNNRVSMNFADRQKQPGHSATLTVSADPHSLCSISVVDKSVKLMTDKDKTLTKSQIFQLLKQYDTSQGPGHYIRDEDCGTIERESNDMDPFDDYMYDAPVPAPRRQRRMIMFPGYTQSDYVDSKAAFSDAGVIVLSDLKIATRPCSKQIPYYRRRIYYDSPPGRAEQGRRAFRRPAMAFGIQSEFLGGPMPVPMSASVLEANSVDSKSSSPPPVLHRNFFPESWLWELRSVSETGSEAVQLELPHTITEWVGSGFCANTKTGLGISSPFAINAFQPFFLSFTLPYSMIRGERVGVPVSVFNYLTRCLKVTLHIQKSTEFQLSNSQPEKELLVCGHQTETLTYTIIPRELGHINFTIRASSVAADAMETNSVESVEMTTAEDVVTRQLLVEAEGKEAERTQSAFVCAPAEGTLSVELPDGIVSDSVRSYTSVIGDVMGPTLTGLDSLLALPTGCGEQNMLKFSPNIFIMQYLQKTNSLSEDIKTKAIGFLQTGYQRELTYRHKDGSYSAFGTHDKEGSTWLTAFVIKSFAQARPFIYIDKNDLDKSIEWMKSIQMENGCFPQVGRVLHKEMKGGLGNDDNLAALTAYVLIALIEAGISPNSSVISLAIECLNIQRVDDTYTQVLMAYAYTMWDKTNAKRNETVASLEAKAVVSDGLKHWKVTNDTSALSSPIAVEMSSYMLLMTLHGAGAEVVAEATPIVKWLSTQRNSRGGFSSTQDTVIALQSLAQFASLVHSDSFNARVKISGTSWDHDVSITSSNRLLLQKKEGQTLPSSLQYTVTGTGCALIQASLKYNTITYQSDEEPAFSLSVEAQRDKARSCKERTLEICTSYNGAGDVSNMAVIAVKMVSGWIPDKDSIKKLMNRANLKLKRHEIDKNVVQLYFDELDKKEKCLSFNVHQNIIVSKTKPALVHVYDYYDPGLSTYAEYSITSTCGTKEEIPSRGNLPQERRNSSVIEQIRIEPGMHPPKASVVLTGVTEKPRKAPQKGNCPECDLKNSNDIKTRYCKSPNVYEVSFVNSTVMTVLTQNRSRVSVQKSVNYRLPPKCKCRATPKNGVADASAVLLLQKPIDIRKRSVTVKLDRGSAVIEKSKVDLILREAAAANKTVCP